jgi:uncharacterized protein (DUF2132 family)
MTKPRNAEIGTRAHFLVSVFPRFHFVCGMSDQSSNDPLHGVTLEMMLNQLVEYYGWDVMAEQVRIRCFHFEPSVKSSLAFLRKTPWARKEVETLYRRMLVSKQWDKPAGGAGRK